MIDIGCFGQKTCQGMTRRSFLRIGAMAPFALGLAEGAVRAAAESARAKSVLLVWLNGGPSHLDLFDPKPKAPAEYRGPFSTIATRTPGVRYSELLPRLAARSDRFALVRSNVNYDQDHRTAGSFALTGGSGPGAPAVYPPNYGAILARHRGQSDLPPFIAVGRGHAGDGGGPLYGYGGGTWGKGHDPFLIRCTEDGELDLPSLKLPEGLDTRRINARKAVLDETDPIGPERKSGKLGVWDETFRKAYSLLSSRQAHAAFDLASESASTREAYGQTTFGQSCLLGRRLVEAGVPYIQVNWSQFAEVFFPGSDYGWDTHSDNFGLMADWHGPLFDRVFSTLLDDLDERGLLATTLVVCMGEFGRTPKINRIGSRDHWPGCYFSLWAGAGVQPGRVVGESDARGEFPATEAISPAMVGTTILELSGVSSAARAELRVLERGRVIHELL
ncbi:MAG: DUF1501 domain-containing protein [Isosphaeraceae bacterium]